MVNVHHVWARFLRLGALSRIAIMLSCSAAFADPAETDAVFGEKVRAYLLENPEVILEVMDVLAAQQDARATRELLAPHVPTLFETQMDLRIGSPDASRIIVEFFDYNCAVCIANVPAMQAFVAANPDVAFVKKHLPILSPGSERAVRFVLAARKVYGADVYAELHDVIYGQIGPLNLVRLESYARDMALDPAMIVDRMQDDDISAVIDQHRNIAIALNVIGTPTFATPVTIHMGAVTPEILAAMAEGA